MASSPDPYQILQIDPLAVPEVVDAAYRALARLHHPDRDDAAGASATMTELNQAYATLRDPALRAAYDRTRAFTVGTPASGSLWDRVQENAISSEQEGAGHGGTLVLDFGRYAGLSLAQVARTDPAYLEWLKRHSSGSRYRRQIDELLSAAASRRA